MDTWHMDCLLYDGLVYLRALYLGIWKLRGVRRGRAQ
jgi:hypothetical protein